MRRLIQILVILVLVLIAAAFVVAWRFDIHISRLVATNAVLYTTSAVLVAFLLILVLRYLFLTLFAFLQYRRQLRDPLLPAEYLPISVILPAYNEGLVIEAALEASLQLDYPNYEVIVVDDGSTDDTYQKAMRIAERHSSNRVRVLTQPNGGKASALNAGIAAARGDLILCSDTDSRLDREALTHAAIHFADPKVAAVAGNVKVANRLNGLTRLQALEYLEGLNLVRAAQAYFKLVTVIPGPVGMFRKEVLNQVGGFHEDTFAEDCDLTLRLMLSGWEIKYESQAIAWTEAPETVQALFRQRYRWGRGVLQSISKNKRFLLGGCPSIAAWAMFWLFVFDGVALPAMDLIGLACFASAAIGGSLSSLIPLWWAQLTILDIGVAILCIAVEREQLSLCFDAIFYRLFFVPFGDLMRCFAWLDELYNVRMNWGTQQRIGRI